MLFPSFLPDSTLLVTGCVDTYNCAVNAFPFAAGGHSDVRCRV